MEPGIGCLILGLDVIPLAHQPAVAADRLAAGLAAGHGRVVGGVGQIGWLPVADAARCAGLWDDLVAAGDDAEHDHGVNTAIN
jgi:hypothetical protein